MPKTLRHVEIDLLRTIAITGMIIYHIAFDTKYFFEGDINMSTLPWETLRITTVSLFLGIAGVSSHFSRFPIRRALLVLACAMLISLVTYTLDPKTYIRFGVLHCIGTGMLLLHYMHCLKQWNIALGLLVIILGTLLQGTIHHTSLFIPFGILPPEFSSLDYYPLLPWYGVMLIGAGIGSILYMNKSQHTQNNTPRLLRYIAYPGKHSLLIYLLHQPILLPLLWLLYR